RGRAGPGAAAAHARLRRGPASKGDVMPVLAIRPPAAAAAARPHAAAGAAAASDAPAAAAVAQAQPEPAAVQPPPRTSRPPGALVYFITPADGETVRSPVVVRFGLQGMGVAPAGVASPNPGHHHLVVDAPTPPLDQPLPADEQHIHFGGGQTETVLALPPGRHELQLILADANHVPHDPPLVS